jgi:hypothetical protein
VTAFAARVDVAVGLRARASTLGTVLGRSGDPALRSKAARLLPRAGSATRFAASDVFRGVARGAPFVSGGVDFVANVAEGQSPPEAFVRAGVPTAAGVAGGMAGAAVCGSVGIATMGIGGLVCAVLVAGFSIGGQVVAGRIVDQVIGAPGGRHDD